MSELGKRSRWSAFSRKYRWWGHLALGFTIFAYSVPGLWVAWSTQRITIGRRTHWTFTIENEPALFVIVFGANVAIALLGLLATVNAVGELLYGVEATMKPRND